MSENLISIIIPVYNEQKTIEKIIELVEQSAIENREIIVVDDCSRDESATLAEKLREKYNNLFVCRHEKNLGKGAAIRTGLEKSQGEIIIIQDADLEYNPSDYPDLLAPIFNGLADVVYGSRFVGDKPHRSLYFSNFLGNRTVTFFANLLTGLNLTDIETGYKVFTRDVADTLRIKENRFGFEPEFTVKVAKAGWRIYEVGIAYQGRTYAEGKKITWKDGLKTIWWLVKYRFGK